MSPAHHPGALRTAVSLVLGALVALGPVPSQAASVILRWTATGDDSTIGRATAYDLRYSVAPITAANFSLATQVAGLPAPANAGTPEEFTVSGLTNGLTYYFAIRARDDANNWSSISNVVTTAARTAGVDPDASGSWFSDSWPNPARGTARFSYSLNRGARVEAFVSDIAGRRIRTLAAGELPAGQGELSWDLTSDAGAHVAAGLYLIHAQLGGASFTRRVVVMR